MKFKKYHKNLVNNSLNIFTVTLNNIVMNCLNNEILMFNIFLSHLSEFKVYYTVTFYYEKIN